MSARDWKEAGFSIGLILGFFIGVVSMAAFVAEVMG